MNKSKIMKNLLAQLETKRGEAIALQNKVDATADEIRAKTDEIRAIKAKIAAQDALDEGRDFDDNGDPVQDITPVNSPMYAQPNSHRGPFGSFGEQMLAVVRSSKPGSTIDNRLLTIQNASGANESIPSEGGFLVQQDFSSGMISLMHDTGKILNLIKPIQIGPNSNGVKMNGIDESSRVNGSRQGGVLGYWANEAAAVTATKPKFRQIDISLNKVMAVYYATDEVVQDAAVLNSILSTVFPEELKFKVEDAVFRGDGAGKPLGWINSGANVAVAKEGGQSADTIVHENVAKMWARLLPECEVNAVWLINKDCQYQLENMVMPIGTGGVLSPWSREYMEKGTIKGRPVLTVEYASTVGDAGDIVLTDPTKYVLADKGGIQSAASMHVQFLYDEMTFRVVYRVDGQPLLSKAITPYKGSVTQSSIITLAERA